MTAVAAAPEVGMVDPFAYQLQRANQSTYQQLQVALRLNLRRQIFLTICDDLGLRDRVIRQLQQDLAMPPAGTTAPAIPSSQLVILPVDEQQPDPFRQMAIWLRQHGGSAGMMLQSAAPLQFQLVGIERLTQSSAMVQGQFLHALRQAEQHLPYLEASWVVWLTRPWAYAIRESAPEFWRWRSRVFEFVGTPTPMPAAGYPAPPLTQPPAPAANPPRADLWSIMTQDLSQPEPPPRPEPPPAPRPPQTTRPELTDPSGGRVTPAAPFGGSGDDPTALADPAGEQPPLAATPAIAPGPSPRPSPPEQLRPPLLPSLTDPSDLAGVGAGQLSRVLEGHSQNHSDLSQLIWVSPPATTSAPAPIAYPPTSPAVQGTPPPLVSPHRTPAPSPQDSGDRMDVPPLTPVSAGTAARPSASAATQPLDPLIPEINPDPTPQLPLPPGLAGQTAAIAARQTLQTELAELQPAAAIVRHAYVTLGNLGRDLIHQGDTTAATLDFTVRHYEQGLAWGDRDGYPLPDVRNDLGNLFWLKARQARESATAIADLQHSIRIYQQAIGQIDITEQPSTYAMVQHNLGTAYGDLAQYEGTVEHLQRAIHCYQQALTYRSAATNRVQYAATQNNLGTAYWRLAQHDHSAVYLQQAIAAYHEALNHAEIEDNPLHYAMIQNNLGTAYWQLAQHDSPEDHLRAAIVGYQIALQYRTLAQHPAAHAATQNNLGAAHRQLAQLVATGETCQHHLIAAVQAYEQAIAAAQRSHHQAPQIPLNFDIGNTHQSLALVHSQLADLEATSTDLPELTEQRLQNYHGALQHHLTAVELWQTRPELRQAALGGVIQVLQLMRDRVGLTAHNQALSQVPPALLSEILPKL